MHGVKLKRSGLVTSRLGFGTSRLHWCEAKVRRRLIDAAFEAGFVHFDTAPAYGDTLSEIELGRALHGRREKVVLATKYGLPSDPFIVAIPQLSNALRTARAVSRKIGIQSKKQPLTATELRRSLEASLRRLRTDYVDLFLLHEPAPDRIPDLNSLRDALAELKRSGLVRHVGLAGDWKGIAPLKSWADPLNPVIQTSEQGWLSDQVPDITYGALAAGPQTIGQRGLTSIVAESRLAAALTRRPDGVVLVSTTKPERLLDLAALAEHAS